ncbi:MAG: flavodoxin family protein [Candidatus Niyogibacteria bacterium]|nr:flavodoxin family protein [Candidatus Niyogibacteria bacterium]
MSTNNYIIGVNGGKKEGHTSGYLKQCLDEAEKLGAKVKLIELSDFTLLPISKSAANPELDTPEKIKSDDMVLLLQEVEKADGIVFATPVHWFSASSEMKIFIDRLTPLENAGFLLEGKVAGFIVYGNEAGKMNALMELSATTNNMGMISPPYSMIYLSNEASDWAAKDIKLLAHNMFKLINCIKKEKLRFGYE